MARVPLARLIANLERAVARAPADPAPRHQLARALAMAWSWRVGEADSVEAVEDDGLSRPWFGYGPPYVPFRDRRGGPEPADSLLRRATLHYERALELDPAELTVRLGLAWCREQAGQRALAIEGYRQVIARAWPEESRRASVPAGDVVTEAAGYLIPLLDPWRDAAEIRDLEAKRRTLSARPRAVTPLAIPLVPGLSPAQVLRPAARVRFDLDGSGRQLEWPWLAPEAGWLVFDPEGAGRVESALQMFGGSSFLLFPSDGYAALALLDDDGDGELAGAELAGLALWRDADGDGVSLAGEVRPLAALGVRALSCARRLHPSGIWFSPGGVRLEDGRRLDSFDIELTSSPARGDGGDRLSGSARP